MFTDLLSSGAPLIAIVAALALIDSTSFGTLAIPIWLLLTPGRVRAGRMLLYLSTIGLFYFAVGALLLFGAASIADIAAGVLDSAFGRTVLVAIGGLLIWWSFARDTKAAKARRASRGEGRLSRWRRIAMGDDAAAPAPAAAGDAGAAGDTSEAGGGGAPMRAATETHARPRASGSIGALMGLALMAGVAEVATLLPYLAAIGLLSQADLAAPLPLLGVAAYCAIMLLPALVLLAARIVAGRRIEGHLRRFEAWLSKHADSTFSWVIGIIGVVIVVNVGPF